MEDLTLAAVIAVALFFDFTNGFHDTANAIATSVSTRALTPRTAVLIAAILNFAGAFVSFAVAATIATGIVNADAITLSVILAGLVGAITWNLMTWFLGLPSSSSHALIGGVSASAIAASGLDVINWRRHLGQGRHPRDPVADGRLRGRFRADDRHHLGHQAAIAEPREPRFFRRGQIVSGSFVAFTHGTNDAQKTMGIIALALIVVRPSERGLHPAADMGHRLVGTGHGDRHLRGRLADHPDDGHADREDRPAAGLRSPDGVREHPLDHGALRLPRLDDPDDHGLRDGRRSEPQFSAVRWGVAGNIVIAWALTLPAAGLVGALMEEVTRLPAGDLIVFLLAGAIAASAFIGASLRDPPPHAAHTPSRGTLRPQAHPTGRAADTQCSDGDTRPHRADGDAPQSGALPSRVPRPCSRARDGRIVAAARAREVLRDLLVQPRRVLPGARRRARSDRPKRASRSARPTG